MKDHFINLLTYNNWANQRAFASIVDTFGIDERAYELLSHIIAAQKIWLSRIQSNGDNPISSWAKFDKKELLMLLNNVHNDWMTYISESNDEQYGLTINYKNSRGEEHTKKIKDVITHVFNHSTYHRGQIAIIVKACGGVPAVTDYIFYVQG
jgi:uncharacterized damage-inducible protein DinB